MTEDHPIEYAEFEGIIPEGHYGAGTVMVWDRGTYETEFDLPLEQQLAGGELKIELHGEKLRGAFVFIHIGRRSGVPREKAAGYSSSERTNGQTESGKQSPGNESFGDQRSNIGRNCARSLGAKEGGVIRVDLALSC